MEGNAFVALEEWFGRTANCAPVEATTSLQAVETPRESLAIAGEESGAEAEDAACRRVVAESARWYARLNDALDAACARLLGDIAAGVLARELHLAPSDLTALVDGLRAQMLGDPLCIRLHPDDCARWNDASLPCRADVALAPGDAVLELHEGSIDARFGLRLQAVLDACSP